jgi:hypothetical protein
VRSILVSNNIPNAREAASVTAVLNEVSRDCNVIAEDAVDAWRELEGSCCSSSGSSSGGGGRGRGSNDWVEIESEVKGKRRRWWWWIGLILRVVLLDDAHHFRRREWRRSSSSSRGSIEQSRRKGNGYLDCDGDGLDMAGSHFWRRGVTG